MATIEAQKKGGMIMAIRQREDALKRYYLNPNKCKFCGEIIKVRDGEKTRAAKIRKFCSQSCSAKFNNLKKNKTTKKSKQYFCERCKEATKNKLLCKKCRKEIRILTFQFRTKNNLFSTRSSWQSARTAIRKNASEVFSTSEKQKKCVICGYDKHTEICHKKSVSSFEKDSKLSEINDINNLVALCPTHHWEFDHGLIEL